jgi:hypothetical protein
VCLLVASWTILAIALLSSFVSLLTSMTAIKNGIEQIDAGDSLEKFGGSASKATAFANMTSAVCVVLGSALMLTFAYCNILGGAHWQTRRNGRAPAMATSLARNRGKGRAGSPSSRLRSSRPPRRRSRKRAGILGTPSTTKGSRL